MKTNEQHGWLTTFSTSADPKIQQLEDARVCDADAVKGMSDKEMKETEQTACSVLCREMHKHKASQSEPIVAFHKLCFSLYNALWESLAFLCETCQIDCADICQKATNENTHQTPRATIHADSALCGKYTNFQEELSSRRTQMGQDILLSFSQTDSANTN